MPVEWLNHLLLINFCTMFILTVSPVFFCSSFIFSRIKLLVCVLVYVFSMHIDSVFFSILLEPISSRQVKYIRLLAFHKSTFIYIYIKIFFNIIVGDPTSTRD